ncbi:MAG: bifunctional tetrahydrofolate synthase/dihydrofolate synthase [Alteromonadaceae bacterium]|nr:bifunctional tetrahydrofolate synthase/dihydrofolate synthase [Alteromonadaceae bacterium]
MNPKGSEPAEAPAARPGPGASVDQWLQYLEAIHPAEIELGLDRVLIVLRRLFPCRPGARIITVAGTNGKGTAVATVERLLLAAGRTTGAYTSPHLERYNERVRLGGADIDDAALVHAFERVERARGRVPLTYFEFGTLAAFTAFEDAGVQDWILEVGLGGRLDAVNVLDADFAMITAVDIDHIGFLGDNREVIGFEKAGILRPGIDAVCADPSPPASVLQQASAQRVSLQVSGRDYRLEPVAGADIVQLIVEGECYRLPAGPLPIESVAGAVVLARKLVSELSAGQIEAILADVQVPGRFEQRQASPRLLLDVGHNPHAAHWLAGKLAALRSGHGVVRGIYAALADKDTAGVMNAMKPVVDTWYFAGLAMPRGLSAGELQGRAAEAGVGPGETFASVAEALEQARADASPDDTIIVFGSFFTVAEARALC